MIRASANLHICNVGSKPTFRTRKREEVLDLTLINRNAENCISDWHVSDVPSFSNHMYIRFRVQSGTKRTKMTGTLDVLAGISMQTNLITGYMI